MLRNAFALRSFYPRALVLLLLVGIGACPDEAPDSVSPTNIRGTVTLDGIPAAGVTVEVMAVGTVRDATTGSDGTYSLFVPSEQTVEVAVAAGLPPDVACPPPSATVFATPDGAEAVDFDCRTPGGGTGGTGGDGGTGGTPGACAEDEIPGQAQLAGPPMVNAMTVAAGGEVVVSVPVDEDTRKVEVLLLGSDGISFAGSGDAVTGGSGTVDVVVAVPGSANSGSYFAEIALLPDANDSDDFTLYSPVRQTSTEDNYDKNVFIDDMGSGVTRNSCLVVRLDVE